MCGIDFHRIVSTKIILPKLLTDQSLSGGLASKWKGCLEIIPSRIHCDVTVLTGRLGYAIYGTIIQNVCVISRWLEARESFYQYKVAKLSHQSYTYVLCITLSFSYLVFPEKPSADVWQTCILLLCIGLLMQLWGSIEMVPWLL